MNVKYLSLSFLVLISLKLFSQTKWSLEDCIKHAKENNIDVWDAVDTLEDASKKIIQFKFHAGWSDDRIADELGISSKVVRRRLKESLALLKARLAA